MNQQQQQKQTKRKSGIQYHLNLDSYSFSALHCSRKIHEGIGHRFSNSVIVRRALRKYYLFLHELTEEDMKQESIEILRASKGVE